MFENQTEVTKKNGNNFLAVSILISAVIVSGSIIYGIGAKARNGNELASVAAGNGKTREKGNSLPTDTGNNAILGNPASPVIIVSYGDYQCPYCAQMFNTVEPLIRSEFIEKGIAQMVYRDFPLEAIHEFARPSANAAECAGEQGKYWLYHDALFKRQASLGTLDFTELAKSLGLDDKTFASCVTSQKYDSEIQKDYDAGVSLGVQGTPATFINGKLLEGALPWSAFKSAIEKAFEASKKDNKIGA